jgi:hypothetical protein
MKATLWCLITLIFSSGAMMAGLHSENIWIGYGLGFLAWILFIWRVNRRSKKASQQQLKT